MHSFQLVRAAALAVAAFALAACSTAGPAAGPSLTEIADAEGSVTDYCPRIGQREETSILRKGVGPELQYIASITDTSRECHILGGQLRMKVGIAGKLVPGPAAPSGTIALPLRVVVQRGADILYSNRGLQSVQMTAGGTGAEFVYVDTGIAIPEPTEKDIAVSVQFDDEPVKTPPKKRR